MYLQAKRRTQTVNVDSLFNTPVELLDRSASAMKLKRNAATLLLGLLLLLLSVGFTVYHEEVIERIEALTMVQRKRVSLNVSTTERAPVSAETTGAATTVAKITDFSFVTAANNSVVAFVNPQAMYSIGNTLNVVVQMHDAANRRKHSGGDFILARLYNERLRAASAGEVTDYGDGSYSVALRLLWGGDSRLSLTLVHPAEAVAVLDRVRETIPNKIVFLGTFASGKVKKVTNCNVHLSTDKETCDLTDPQIGEPWSCEKPANMSCSALQNFRSYNRHRTYVSKQEEELFARGRLYVPLNVNYTVTTRPPNNTVEQKLPPCTTGLGNPSPSGFFWNGAWNSSYCAMRRFDTPQLVTECLKEKHIYFLGDSTIRQWWEYLVSFTKGFKYFDVHKRGKQQPKIAFDDENKIILQWNCHGYPFITQSLTFSRDVQYIAKQLDDITGGKNTVIGLSLGAHFTAFPLAVFERRMRNIAASVEKLLSQSPDTKVIVKLPNTRDVGIVQLFNNWNTYRLVRITLDVFKHLNVAFVDAWEMTAVVNSLSVHPTTAIVKEQLNVFLSFVC
ncbi:NXPE family member 2-like isoform X1 [Petromyzon marinus]|uniref:NXPE family member 2-like isoform X1 n=2 Tax=Petromyzon marinus TaxID=7757 RepID=UPI003F70A3CF